MNQARPGTKSKNNQSLNQNSNKQLPDVFRELKEAQRRQVQQELKERQSHKFNTIHTVTDGVVEFFMGNHKNNLYANNQRKTVKKPVKTQEYYGEIDEINYINMSRGTSSSGKFNAIGAILGILFLIMFSSVIKSNYIFATTPDDEDRKIIGHYEENNEPIDVMGILSENMSEVVKKDIVTEEQVIEREVEYIENNQLPKDEQVVIEEGFDGNKEITYIRSYENNELKDEKIINENVLLEPAKAVIQVGTSEYLLNKKAHIGDTVYTDEEVIMYSQPRVDDEISICKIYELIDVTLDEVLDGWCKVTVDGYQGYVKADCLTTAGLEPDIVEKSRIQRIMITVKYDMPLNKPSGLTKEDFIKVLSGNAQDTNKIFEDNAEFFYEIEQKYNVNGVLLASIGIHESAWGTSKIANDKKNLFGYGAYDSSPYASAFNFDSYAEGVELLAKVLSKYYLNEAGTPIYDGETAVASFYNGPTVAGINVRYASDPLWSQKVFNKMEMLYNKLR